MDLAPKDAEHTATSLPLPECGQRVSVETARHTEKLWTQMIGFKPGAYLVLEKPPGTDAIDGKRALKDGDSLVIRFIKEGSIYGFRTPVLCTATVPYRLLFVGFPIEVAEHSLRSSPRLECYLPCEGEVDGRSFSRAFIRDFSATGCQLRIPLDAFEEEDDDAAQALAEVSLPGDTGVSAIGSETTGLAGTEANDSPAIGTTAEDEATQTNPAAQAAQTARTEHTAQGAQAAQTAQAADTAQAAQTDATLEAADTGTSAEFTQEPSTHIATPPDASRAPAEAFDATDETSDETDHAAGENRLTLFLQLPGEEDTRIAHGEVLDWQTLPRFHQLRVKFDELQAEIFDQLTHYTMRLG